MPHVTVAVLWKAYTDTDALGCDVRTKVEAPLDIKDVIHQVSCFSKTSDEHYTAKCWKDQCS